MTATTAASLGAHQDHRQAPYHRFTVFTWHAHLFHSVCKTMGIQYEVIEDDEYPYYSIFQFTCGAPWLIFLIQRYVESGYPFSLTNFNLREKAD
jgi:hypothetical protein